MVQDRIGFWEKTMDISCYFLNQSPLSMLDDKTPLDLWTSKKPSLKHFNIFICDAYVQILEENRSKLDNKS